MPSATAAEYLVLVAWISLIFAPVREYPFMAFSVASHASMGGNDAEHHHRHLDAAGVGCAVRGQVAQARTQQKDERHQHLGQGGHQLVNQGE